MKLGSHSGNIENSSCLVQASEEEEDQLVCEDASEAEKKAQKTATSGSSDSKGSSLDRREEFGDAFVTADFKGKES